MLLEVERKKQTPCFKLNLLIIKVTVMYFAFFAAGTCLLHKFKSRLFILHRIDCSLQGFMYFIIGM